MRRATEAGRPAIEAFLRHHVVHAMFPLSNLATYGMADEQDYSMRFWLAETGGRITGILSTTRAGTVMPCLPDADVAAAAPVLSGQQVLGIIGPRLQVRGIEAAVGLTQAPRNLDHDEPHLRLDLTRLTIPDGPGQIVPIAEAPPATLYDWMEDYQRTVLGTPPGEARARARQSHQTFCTRKSHVVLMDGDMPLAMTGFNAQLPEVVQIGGVYTPPDKRGQGYARRALALHLAQARNAGVGQATLFASSDMAVRSYRSIGFDQIGDWTLLLFDGPQECRA